MNRISKLFVLLLGVFALSGVSAPASAAMDMFLYIEGIEGESADLT